MAKLINLVGRKYTRLTVLSFSGWDTRKQRLYECRCDCGKVLTVVSVSLTTLNTQSCGCLRKDRVSFLHKTHGESNKTKEYNTWAHIRARCYNINNKSYINYGGRGITVCDRWLNSFSNFLADIGRAPTPKHSIDRKENNGNYEPGNCFWATKSEQNNNTRSNHLITYDGKTQNISQWCRELKINERKIRSRLSYKWPIERLFS